MEMMTIEDQAGGSDTPAPRGEVIATPQENDAGGEVERNMAAVKFAGSVTIPPSAHELARQEAEMEAIRDMIQGTIHFCFHEYVIAILAKLMCARFSSSC